MKTTTLFELGFLDLIKALFFGKKITLTLGSGGFYGTAPTGFNAGDDAGGSTNDSFEDQFRWEADTFPDTDWNAGRMWTDPYHVNPFTVDPFDRM